MKAKSLLLASASPARRTTLVNAGIPPIIAVADLDEDILLEQAQSDLTRLTVTERAKRSVELLASAKAHHVFHSLNELGLERSPAVIVGCDSMLEMNGVIVGKPHTEQVARERLRSMSGNPGTLHTGHCVIDTATGQAVTGVSSTVVHIGELSEEEIDAYIGTGEPLHVAGSFTIDGFGGPFIERIEGDHHGVVGISLPLLRHMLAQLGHSIVEFWER
ncbi:MAG: septum formation inhibitor Maf [Actinomycetaceae bacterium]|nr:septum formation inhibitor Maf [Actinomycetaceae bacterium]